MPQPKKTASTTKRPGAKEPAALRQLTKSLDGAQTALAKLRADLGRDVSTGSKALYKDLERFVKDARRDSGKLGKALQRDLAAARSAAGKATAKPAARATTTRKTATRKATTRSTTARKK
jgi:hypothetical protein